MSSSAPHILFQTDPALGLPAWISFAAPLRIMSAHRHDDILPLLREVEYERERGRWAAGFVSYEAAPAMDPALATHLPGALPLAWFGLYDEPAPAAEPGWTIDAPPMELCADLDSTGYCERLAAIKDAIARGETYQVNFTLRLRGPAPANPLQAFACLHHAQRGGYGAYIGTDAFALCSASPELFFLQNGSSLLCRPMKGTSARGASWMEDERLGSALRASTKDRAENVMIVDMVRNDLGRLAQPGTVRTSRLFETQRLPTLWQMTSTVEAETTAGLAEIFTALFPCASITGAPKIQTARLIRELETSPRGVYTGAMGFAGPKRVAQFNVAIRTLVIDRDTAQGEYGIGSGVVWDSDPQLEYEECLSKARILRRDIRPFHLLSTLAWRPGDGYVLLNRHLARLLRAATYFGFAFNADTTHEVLNSIAISFPPHAHRVRLLVDHAGHCDVEHSPLPPPAERPWRIALASQPVNSHDCFLYFKTTRRAVYEQAQASHPGFDEIILWNEQGEITEGCITNIAIQRDGQWITPPLSCGLLEGVMREDLLARGKLVEGTIALEEFRRAPEIAVFNSVRGWMTATWNAS